MTDDVSPCGKYVAWNPELRALTLTRFGIVEQTARPDLLLLDIDLPKRCHVRKHQERRRLSTDDAAMVAPLRTIRAVCSKIGLSPLWVKYKRTRRGFHVTVKLPWSQRLQRAEIVALQSCLGSDSWRESLNLMRVVSIRKHGSPREFRNRWNLLFERKLPA